MGGGIHGGFGATKGARDVAKGKQRFNSEEAGLIKELERNHKKFTKDRAGSFCEVAHSLHFVI